jgi:DNA processing protein
MNRQREKPHLYFQATTPSARTSAGFFALLKADEATHIDEIVERLEPELSSSEIFAAWFELELAGKVRQLAGKNFVKSF